MHLLNMFGIEPENFIEQELSTGYKVDHLATSEPRFEKRIIDECKSSIRDQDQTLLVTFYL